jgi:hypothetical protein
MRLSDSSLMWEMNRFLRWLNRPPRPKFAAYHLAVARSGGGSFKINQ